MQQYTFAEYSRQGENIALNKSIYLEGKLSEHSHNFFEIVYITRGTGYHILNGQKSVTQRGDLFFLGFNVFHTFVPISKDFAWINCLFLPDAVDKSLYDASDPSNILKIAISGNLNLHNKLSLSSIRLYNLMDEFDVIFKEMLNEYTQRPTGYQKIIKNYLNILLLKIFRSMDRADQEKGQSPSVLDNNNLIDLVHDYFMSYSSYENIKLSDIAKKAFISPKYFSNLFKKKTGQNLTQFIHKIKIDKACSLLEDSSLTIAEVMEYVGYKDSKFFYALFKKHKGCTPGQYRRLHRGSSTADTPRPEERAQD